MDVKNKIILITGASRGIGAETAKLLAEKGGIIIGNYFISEFEPEAGENIQQVQKDIIGKKGNFFSIHGNVGDEEEVKSMISQIKKLYGHLDIIINNAGIVYDIPVNKKTITQFQHTIQVNLIGTFIVSREGAKLMKNGGKIINISSTNGIDTYFPHSLDYDASKAGIISLTKNLAEEYAPRILVNSIAPGWVNTEMNSDLDQKLIHEESEKCHLKRFAEPIEIANVILFLCSKYSTFINGETIKVDGGLR